VIALFGWAISDATVKWAEQLTRYEVLYLALTALGATAVVPTFIIYWRMLRSMQHGSTGQSILALIDYLQKQEIRDARGIVLLRLVDKPLGNWTPGDREAAGMVCSSYDVAGILVRRDFVPIELLTDSYAASSLGCFPVTKPFIDELRKSDHARARVSTRWSNFEWLHAEASKRYPQDRSQAQVAAAMPGPGNE
jgi:hypothetical protein